MSILGKPQGIFDLNDSDHCVGSSLLKDDVKEIPGINDNDLRNITFINKDDKLIIDERELQQLWYNDHIENAPKPKKGNTKVSLDELLLTLRKSKK
jgi:hypothetical protein